MTKKQNVAWDMFGMRLLEVVQVLKSFLSISDVRTFS